MLLRNLEKKDAEGMLEWMTDTDIIKHFRIPNNKSCMKEILNFIDCANKKNSTYKHYAIVDDSDQYLGTISLKNIDLINNKAEYAIATRKCTHGTGVAQKATLDILKIGFEDLKLNKIYLNVLEENRRAIHFYEKIGFIKEGIFREDIFNKATGYQALIWYSMLISEYKRRYHNS